MLKRIIITAALMLMCGSAASAADTVVFDCDRAAVTVNGAETPTAGAPFSYGGSMYVPVDDTLCLSGFSLGWDSARGAVAAYKDGVFSYIPVNSAVLERDGETKEFALPTKISNGVFYMPLNMYTEISGAQVSFTGTPEKCRDLLDDTVVPDGYRYPDSSSGTYKGVTIVGTRGMELLYITDSSASAYAQMVNSVAAALPEVDVFNAAIPTASELYAPKSICTDQTRGVKLIYSMLDKRVTPVNAVKALSEHAAEKIYFDTDHHWTQRGAYYAYREFARLCGFELPALEDFEKNDSWSHVGSFAAFAKGTYAETVLRANPELLERFMPKVASRGEAFTDMYMKNKYYSPVAVNPSVNAYSCFAGGDCPVAKFTTDNKNGRRLCIIKESYGNAFATWALNNYEEVYIIDPREFNGFNGHNAAFRLREFYNMTHFDDLVIINYPGGIGSSGFRLSVMKML